MLQVHSVILLLCISYSYCLSLSCCATEQKYPGLHKILKHASTACCVACFHDENKPLAQCVVALKGNNPSNCKQHMTNKHKEDMPGKEFRMLMKESEDENSNSIQRLLASGSAVSRTASSSASVGGGSLVGAFPFAKTKIPKQIIQRGNDLQLHFMRSCNIAARHGNSQDLKNYLDHVLDNSLFYNKNRSSMLMGRLKVSNQRYRSFNQLVNVVKGMVDRSREWLKVQTKSNNTPFITVGHDGWDSKDRDMLGICIHFVDIDKGKMRTIAVGLQEAHSKKSAPTAEHTLSMLERYVVLCVQVVCCFQSTP